MNERNPRYLKGYDKLYLAYPDGRVWSYTTKDFMSITYNGHGYAIISLTDRYGTTRTRRLHILLAETFLEKPESDQQLEVAHLDDNRANNDISNLCWMTHKENCNQPGMKKKISEHRLGKPNKRAVRCIETGEEFASLAAAARAYNVTPQAIGMACRGEIKSCALGRHWEYVS